MQVGLPLVGGTPDFEIGDDLDRCYTPQRLAHATTATVAAVMASQGLAAPRLCLEPSVGGGAFVRAVRARWSGVQIIGVDIDAQAAGLGLCDRTLVGPYRPARAGAFDCPDLVLGNPPFSEALEHWVETARAFPGAFTAMIMPWGYPGVKKWAAAFEEAKPCTVHPILGRPWPKRVRETAVYMRAPTRASITEMKLPALDWQRGDRDG